MAVQDSFQEEARKRRQSGEGLDFKSTAAFADFLRRSGSAETETPKFIEFKPNTTPKQGPIGAGYNPYTDTFRPDGTIDKFSKDRVETRSKTIGVKPVDLTSKKDKTVSTPEFTNFPIIGGDKNKKDFTGVKIDQKTPSEKITEEFGLPQLDLITSAADEQLEGIQKFREEELKGISDLQSQQLAGFEERRKRAEQARIAQQSGTIAQKGAMLSEVERRRKAAFNRIKGQLSKLGALGTTGAAELNIGLLGEAYDNEELDVRSKANEQLRDIETKYLEIVDAIDADEQTSFEEKQKLISNLNTNATRMWQDIQKQKSQDIADLNSEIYALVRDDQQQGVSRAIAAINTAIQSGAQLSREDMIALGLDENMISIYLDVIDNAVAKKGEERALEQLQTRLEGLESAVLGDYTVNEDTINQLAKILGEDAATLMEAAERIAAGRKAEADRKLASSKSGGSTESQYYAPVNITDKVTGQVFQVRRPKDPRGQMIITDLLGNVPDFVNQKRLLDENAEQLRYIEGVSSLGGLFDVASSIPISAAKSAMSNIPTIFGGTRGLTAAELKNRESDSSSQSSDTGAGDFSPGGIR